MIRDLHGAFENEFNRFESGNIHTLHASDKHWSGRTKWKSNVHNNISSCTTADTAWFRIVHTSTLHIVGYEKLVNATQNAL